ncbi:5-methylthioadenosine/S-adenosylhomocysteine deaminase [Devosia equisanguinis]|uniref:5-methylthioadenosine/S-adenosylhomocysteine deaminase n=1 Tax=Devosia equisanguinis TaxID=2490941 RepID=A0A447I747_9HYPH|nr:amidohydrolase [Devosia equisanguinis]VDS03242.1 5-methylthioadenosine/S-adenosylhomocysteine deaminase [Devosia equisanguinis]
MTILFTNALVVTMDDDLTVHERGWVQVDGSVITALGGGPAPDIAGAEILDCDDDIVMPGMVNAHCHMAMSLFRGLGEDVDDRLYRYILPLERTFVSPEMVRAGSALSALEMIQGGVTTVADMYYFETEVGDVCAEAGLRAIVGQTLADFSPPDHRSFDEGFARVEDLMDRFAGHPLVTPSIAPHAPYSTGLQTMARIAEWSEAHPNVPVQIHLAESTLEVKWAQETHSKSSVAVTQESGLLKPNLICAHCLQLDDDDILMMSVEQVCVVTNPRSNGKAGRGISPVEKLRNAGLPRGIGSDGAMSGNTLDLFSQFAPVSMFAKLLAGSRKPLPAVEVIQMATIEGARALSLNLKTGSLEPGKQADLIRVSTKSSRMQPMYDPYSALVFAAMPTDVTHTMVAGRWLMRNRQVQTLEPARIMSDANQIARQFKGEMARLDSLVP